MSRMLCASVVLVVLLSPALLLAEDGVSDEQRYNELVAERDRLRQRLSELMRDIPPGAGSFNKPIPQAKLEEIRQVRERGEKVQQELSTYRIVAKPEGGVRVVKAVSLPDLLKTLNEAYQQQLAREPRPGPVREAAQLFKNTNDSSHWSDYMRGVQLLRQSRARAGVPLLLFFTLKHESGNNIDLYAQTLTLLTGEKVTFERPKVVFEVERLADQLLPGLDQRSMRLEDMNPEQLRRVVGVLTKLSGMRLGVYRRSGREAMTANDIHNCLNETRQRESTGYRWYAEDLSPALTPYLLEQAGYAVNATAGKAAPAGSPPPASQPAPRRADDLLADGPAAPGDSLPAVNPAVPFAVIPLLAQLRKDGRAPELEKLAVDRKQPAAVRLVCMMAQHCAGERFDEASMVEIATKEPVQDLRLTGIIALGYCGDRKSTTAVLLPMLNDANSEVVAAAGWAFYQSRPLAAAEPLVKVILRDPVSDTAASPAIAALGVIGGKTSIEGLARFMQSDADNRLLYQATMAFCQITGVDWMAVHVDRDEKATAARALAAWRAGRTTRAPSPAVRDRDTGRDPRGATPTPRPTRPRR